MKILLAGEFYSDNLGDPLLCRTVEAILREYDPQAQIIPFDMSGKLSPTEYYEPKTNPLLDAVTKGVCDRYRYYRRAAICRAYESDKGRHLRVWYRMGELLKRHRFDLVIFAGGSLFMDYFAGVINLMMRRLLFTRTKVIFHACGMSTLSADGEYLLGQVLGSRRIVSISLRDSYERFNRLFTVKAPVTETFDTALLSSRYYRGADRRELPLGVGFIDRCYDTQMDLVRQLLASGLSWKGFTNGSLYDQDYARKLLLDAGIPEDDLGDYLLPRPQSPEELARIVTGFEKIIAFRMHSQILAASFGVPSFGFAWDGKVTAFYEKLGFPQGVTETSVPLSRILDTLSQYDGGIRQRVLEQGERSRRSLIQAVDSFRKE